MEAKRTQIVRRVFILGRVCLKYCVNHFHLLLLFIVDLAVTRVRVFVCWGLDFVKGQV
jgi:hypothetical protein